MKVKLKMSEDGYLQSKLMDAEFKITELQNAIKIIQMKSDVTDRKLSSIEIEKKIISDIDLIINNAVKKIELKNEEQIKKDILNLKELVEKIVSNEIEKRLKDKLIDYDAVCEKACRITSRLIDEWERNDPIVGFNKLNHRLEAICDILIKKKISSVREIISCFKSHEKRTIKEILK